MPSRVGALILIMTIGRSRLRLATVISSEPPFGEYGDSEQNDLRGKKMKIKSIAILIICRGFGIGIVFVVGQAMDLTGSVAAAVEVPSVDVSSVAAAEETPVGELRAKRILQAMGEYLKTAKAFSVHGEITYEEVLASGRKLQYSASNNVMVRRPNRIRADYRGDLRKSSFWYDGKSITLLHLEENLYATFSAPNEIDATIDFAMEKYGLSLPVADFVYSDPYAVLIENVRSGFYEGLHMVNGVRCHHLAFTQENIDWQIWIEDGAQIVPRKLVITYKDSPESPQYTAVLSDWDFSVRLPDILFTFEASVDAEQIEFLTVPEGQAENSEKGS